MPVCGSGDPYHNKCEVLDISKDQWRNIDFYPYDQGSIQLLHTTFKFLLIPINASSFWNQAVVYVYSSYFYFGGHELYNGQYSDLSTIARLDGSSYKWNKVGQLNEGSRGHNAIHLNGHFLVVGGYGTKKTEKCEYKNNQMVCQSQSPILTDYRYTPELMIVADDFCD